MGRDVKDWTALDAETGGPVRAGLGWARQTPPGHEFIEIKTDRWRELIRLAKAGDVIQFDRCIWNSKAQEMYQNAKPDERATVRRVFGFLGAL